MERSARSAKETSSYETSLYECPMIDPHTWPTPNGHKVHIMLEECGLPCKAHPIVIGKREQFKYGVLHRSE